MFHLPSIHTFFPTESFQYGDDFKKPKIISPQQTFVEINFNTKENSNPPCSITVGNFPSFNKQPLQFNLLFSSNINPQDKHNSIADQLQKNQFIQLLKWISGSFPLTVQYFFQLHHSFFKSLLPISKRELSRLTSDKLVYFIDFFQEAIKSIIKIEDIFTLLDYTFKSYCKPNMKNIIKINLDTFYSVGYRSFFPSHEPFENLLKEMKDCK
jgi:hypothetical protein